MKLPPLIALLLLCSLIKKYIYKKIWGSYDPERKAGLRIVLVCISNLSAHSIPPLWSSSLLSFLHAVSRDLSACEEKSCFGEEHLEEHLRSQKKKSSRRPDEASPPLAAPAAHHHPTAAHHHHQQPSPTCASFAHLPINLSMQECLLCTQMPLLSIQTAKEKQNPADLQRNIFFALPLYCTPPFFFPVYIFYYFFVTIFYPVTEFRSCADG